MRRLTAILATALVLLTGCDPEGGKPSTERRPGAGGQQPPPPALATEANQPGPQDDPGACNSRGKRSVALQAHWNSETRVPPVITWAHNGAVTPATNVQEGHKVPSQLYSGEWSTLVTVQCHDVLSLSIAGTRSALFAMCAIIDLGDGPVKTGERNCEVHYTVP